MSIITTTGKLEGVGATLATMEECRMTLANAREAIDDDDAWAENVDAENALIRRIADHAPTCMADAAFQLRLAESLIKEESAVWESQTLATVQRVAAYLESRRASVPPVVPAPDPHHAWVQEHQELSKTASDLQANRARVEQLRECISLTPPNTATGALAQLRFWHDWHMEDVVCGTEGIIESNVAGNLDLRAQEMALAFLEAQNPA
ncbi:MAG: hypothetical protein AAGA21_16300 [Pseudomonadota bacterium]